MAKMIDMQTVTRGILPSNFQQFHAYLKATYLDNGWELFNTHYMKQVDEEVHMVYVFVKYEPEPVAVYTPQITWANSKDTFYAENSDGTVTASTSDAEAPRRRGRPRKVEASA